MSSGGGGGGTGGTTQPPYPYLPTQQSRQQQLRRSYANVVGGNGGPQQQQQQQQQQASSGNAAASAVPYQLLSPASSSMPPIQPLPPPITRQASRGSLGGGGGGMEVDSTGASLGAGVGTPGWKRPGSSWSTGAGGDGIRGDGRIDGGLEPFFVPSYLRNSRHMERLRVRWETKAAEIREQQAHSSSLLSLHNGSSTSIGGGAGYQTGSLSTSSSHASLGARNPSAHANPHHQHRNSHHHHHHHSHSHQHHHISGAGPPLADVVERVTLLPPQSSSSTTSPLDDNDPTHHPLPTRWSETDVQPQLELLQNGTELRFDGVTKQDGEAASVRTNNAIPREAGIYYFEVTVLSRAKEGLIGIGFSDRRVPLSRLPGWENFSWGYHGDDGSFCSGASSGRPYGPRFAAQDVIGAGVNFRTGEVFFARNGVFLGVAYTGLNDKEGLGPLFPSVGVRKAGEHLRTNFGQHPFAFDIDSMMERERATVMTQVNKGDVGTLHPLGFKEESLCQLLIKEYLEHECYIETLKVISDEWVEKSSLSPDRLSRMDRRAGYSAGKDFQAANRQKVRGAILEGDIDRAFKYLRSFYPKVLDDDRYWYIIFELSCRKFVEMMRRYSELQTASSIASDGVVVGAGKKTVPGRSINGDARVDPIRTQNVGVDVDDGDHELDTPDEDDDEDDDIADTQMELDDQLNRESGSTSAASGISMSAAAAQQAKLNLTSSSFDGLASDDIEMSTAPNLTTTTNYSNASVMKQTALLTAALEYGRELQSKYGKDEHAPRVKQQLEDIFALLAYSDPVDSVVGKLMDPKGRAEVAEMVNRAILISQDKSPASALETVLDQSLYILDQVEEAKPGGATAFVNVHSEFLRP